MMLDECKESFRTARDLRSMMRTNNTARAERIQKGTPDEAPNQIS